MWRIQQNAGTAKSTFHRFDSMLLSEDRKTWRVLIFRIGGFAVPGLSSNKSRKWNKCRNQTRTMEWHILFHGKYQTWSSMNGLYWQWQMVFESQVQRFENHLPWRNVARPSTCCLLQFVILCDSLWPQICGMTWSLAFLSWLMMCRKGWRRKSLWKIMSPIS